MGIFVICFPTLVCHYSKLKNSSGMGSCPVSISMEEICSGQTIKSNRSKQLYSTWNSNYAYIVRAASFVGSICAFYVHFVDVDSIQSAQCIRIRKAITGFTVLRQWMPFGCFENCSTGSSSSHFVPSIIPYAVRLQNVNNLYGYCTIFSWNKSNNENSCCIRFAIKFVRTRTQTHCGDCLCSKVRFLLPRHEDTKTSTKLNLSNFTISCEFRHTIQNAKRPYSISMQIHAPCMADYVPNCRRLSRHRNPLVDAQPRCFIPSENYYYLLLLLFMLTGQVFGSVSEWVREKERL